MDWWDPSLLNALATRRPVILFDGQGVGRTAGTVPLSIEGMAEDMIRFVEALPAAVLQGRRRVDLLGYSMGSRVGLSDLRFLLFLEEGRKAWLTGLCGFCSASRCALKA